ncbi:MAG TPA: tetratricopeptide repeat protein [Thermoanaerobaculia bacterium]|nr:tetratricopeptide repeat protein [Thermoanaerobaculia bacterium]
MDGKVDRAEAEQRHREILQELDRLDATQDATIARVVALEERVRRMERSGAVVTEPTSTTPIIASRSPSSRDRRRARQLVRNGDELLARGAMREAIEAYDRALVLNLDSSDAYAGRAKAHEQLQSYDEALHDLRSAMSRDESRQDLLLIRAGIYRKLREFDKAIADYTTFLSRARHYPEKALYGRGCAHVEAGNAAAASADYAACINLAPASREAQSARELLRKLAAR